MANGKHVRLSPKRPRALERPQYEANGYISASDLQAEQRYRLERLQHHNRYSHGEGVVCGLQVVPARIAARPWALRVCPGYAIGCCGEEMVVGSSALLDVRDYLWNRPTENGRPAPHAFIAIGYAEEVARPVTASEGGCAQDMTYERSRLRDAYRLEVLWTAQNELRSAFDMCNPGLASCPDCAGRAYVVLARVTLPENESAPFGASHIDQDVRRSRFSMTMLQNQLIRCCCDTDVEQDR